MRSDVASRASSRRPHPDDDVDGAAASSGLISVVSGRAPASPNVVLAICFMSVLMVGLDTTILNVALPDIQRDLDATIAGVQWTIAVFTVTLACLLMLGGSTGDRFGRCRVIHLGLLLFTLGSLLCGIAPTTIALLVVLRVVQAVGGKHAHPRGAVDGLEHVRGTCRASACDRMVGRVGRRLHRSGPGAGRPACAGPRPLARWASPSV